MSDDLDRHQLRPLLDRLTQGDRTALNELFSRLRPYLHALVRRTLGQDCSDASDIVQSSLRRINENLEKVLADPTVPHLLAWVKKIVHNRAIDEVRKRARTALTGGVVQLDNLEQPVPPQERAQREQRALGVLAALEKLPQRQRQVVELHYFDRLRDVQISERLGGSVAAIRVLRCRALKELRRLMEAKDVAE